MDRIIAVFGAGRMGSVVARQLPDGVDKIIIDPDKKAADTLGAECGGRSSDVPEDARDADIVALVIPAPLISDTAASIAPLLKRGAIILNMATKGAFDEELISGYPDIHFVDARIIGHAASMKKGSPGLVVVKTQNRAVFERIKNILPGYSNVTMGDSDLVPIISSIGSSEGIRAAIRCRKLLKEYNIPKEWEDVVIKTVCAGTMFSYVEDDLGEFARALAEKLEKEDL